jgi:hypothetical protein
MISSDRSSDSSIMQVLPSRRGELTLKSLSYGAALLMFVDSGFPNDILNKVVIVKCSTSTVAI